MRLLKVASGRLRNSSMIRGSNSYRYTGRPLKLNPTLKGPRLAFGESGRNDGTHPEESRPCALLLFMHFYPSSEVGARRMSAYARVVASAGLDVFVVSAFGNASMSNNTQISPGVFAVPVLAPTSLLIGRLVRLKRWIRRFMRHSPSVDVPPIARRPTFAPISLLSHMGRQLLSAVTVIDCNKKWAALAYRRALRLALQRKVKVVITSGPPYSGVLCAVALANRLNIPLIADFRDPMVSADSQAKPTWNMHRWFRQLLEKRIVRRADIITCASPGIATHLAARYPMSEAKLKVVMNGYDGNISRRSVDTNHTLKFVFAGDLYINRDAVPFLEALEHLLKQKHVDPKRISVEFIGARESPLWLRLRQWLPKRRCEQVVSLIPELPEEQMRSYVDAATVLLNFAQWQPMQIPAKTFEHLASGREILAVSEAGSDTSNLLDRVPGVHRISPEDPEAMYRVLDDLYRRHVIQGRLRPLQDRYVTPYSREFQNRVLLEVLVTATGALRS